MIYNGTEQIILGNSFMDWLSDFIGAKYNVHIHTDSVGGVTTVPTVLAVEPSNILSEVVKTK